ncbi:MAG TPA: DUF2271 domain-containing protein [Steroidobacteraceae bacterium]|nr:DUF2271 domain-containing protein [Steroidobacteraceae bacterium]
MTTPTALAAELSVAIEIPRLDVAENHRPYVAVWLEREDQSVAANLAVWYETGNRKEGTKWLAELRQWWRRSGRNQTLPIDGVTSPTKPAGTHQLRFTSSQTPLNTLATGKYWLVVEGARENGGREVLRIPFEWPAKQPQSLSAKGEHELGALALNLTP